MKQATLIDLDACIGCDACVTACRAEHGTPPGVSRISLRVLEDGVFPDVHRSFMVNRCQQCGSAPCTTICPTGALARRSDGVVTLDADTCLSCRACLAACPYDALFIHPTTGLADKCDSCAHRLDQGIEPACAVACPTGAIRVGDQDDPEGMLARALASGSTWQRRPELGVRPLVHYMGASRPVAGLRTASIHARAELPEGAVVGGDPRGALVVSDAGGRAGLGVRASLLWWTQGLAAGVYLVPALGVAAGAVPSDHLIFRIVAPLIGLVYLAGSAGVASWATGGKGRFMLFFKRPNSRSWLARGAWLSLGLAGVLLLQLLSTLARVPMQRLLLVPGIALGLLVAMLGPLTMRQCPGRALWQPARGLLRGVAASLATGGAMLSPFVAALSPELAPFFSATTALGALAWLATCAMDLLLPAAQAPGAPTSGLRHSPWRVPAWGGVLLTLTGLLTPVVGAWVMLPLLAGPLLYGHAFVGAGQSAPQS